MHLYKDPNINRMPIHAQSFLLLSHYDQLARASVTPMQVSRLAIDSLVGVFEPHNHLYKIHSSNTSPRD